MGVHCAASPGMKLASSSLSYGIKDRGLYSLRLVNPKKKCGLVHLNLPVLVACVERIENILGGYSVLHALETERGHTISKQCTI